MWFDDGVEGERRTALGWELLITIEAGSLDSFMLGQIFFKEQINEAEMS